MMKKTSELIWQDKQHQVLFELIDEINSKDVDEKVFRKLFDYAESHFAMEEEYMVKLNFPHTKEHVVAHDKFRAELKCMLKEFHSFDEIFRQALSQFLSEWLKSHIFGIDKKLEEYILNSRYK